MRLTNQLCAQHIGWHFKKHWLIQGKRVPRETGAAAELLRLSAQVRTPNDILAPKKERLMLDFIGTSPRAISENNANLKSDSTACHYYNDNSLLIGGLPQAQVLTNTIEVKTFPPKIEEAVANQKLPNGIDRNIRNAILSAHVLDAEQVKLPKIKLIERPAFNLPRNYGISHERINRLLVNKILHEIEKLAGRSLAVRRKLFDNAAFKASLNKDSDKIGFAINANKLVCSNRAIEGVKLKFNGNLPDLYPMKCTISIPKKPIVQNDFYPFRTDATCSHPHTVFSVFDTNLVNTHGSEVTTSQFQARTLLKGFVVAVARAKHLYGASSEGDLAKPIVVQSVQTDGRTFHFGVFQLNTLDISSKNSLKNYWFHRESYELFSKCGYEAGRAYLDNYNSDIFRILNALYCSS
ncbi:39S ribosomal protein L37, mitochondrial [Drosophila pseudoobscura]|uniref:Large ribosomal subunit protein mL37 n=1 Tax=Drosophila pseudoobscura pseudoobscura TaxID=46245 RepID=A0A6I8V5X3_DROPS|nr:39S ribosomal protein L37, mitochondrial [Drosophila pseudoobscura]